MRRLGVAVVGSGRAGRARIAALQQSPDAELRAVIVRSGALRLEDALADPGIDALLVCTPNALHADSARRALAAGKHVGVEYPLATRAAEARELFALARVQQRVLHVEHIELLSPAQEHQRRRARELGALRRGTLEFSGSFEGWIADPALAGSPALLALARLHRLVDLFGPARIERAALAREPSGYRLEAELQFAAGGSALLREQRAPGLPRALRWKLRCAAGDLGDPPAAPAQGLFARDLAHFVERIQSGRESYVSEARIEHALELVEQIENVLKNAGCC